MTPEYRKEDREGKKLKEGSKKRQMGNNGKKGSRASEFWWCSREREIYLYPNHRVISSKNMKSKLQPPNLKMCLLGPEK